MGVHIGDDAVHLARVGVDDGGRPVLLAATTVPLPPGLVVDGVVVGGGRLPDRVSGAMAAWVAGDPVRIALASDDAVVVPLGEAGSDPVAAAADRVARGRETAGDAMWADAVHVLDRPVALAAVRRSSVLRLRDALGRAGLPPEGVDTAPTALVAAVLTLLPPPEATWTVQLTGPHTAWRATVGRGLRLEGGRASSPPGSPDALHVHVAGRPVDEVGRALCTSLGPQAQRGPGPETVRFVLAIGAALGGLPDRVVTPPDLGRAVVVRPFAPVGDPLPRWAVEGLVVEDDGGRDRARRLRPTRRASR